ncbi:MAG TPA: hypothetical protein VF547_07435 [Allosphingosinicella sp.]|jgi:hypothetical protein
MPTLTINTHSDAEVFIIDASLELIDYHVGATSRDLDSGLYKIKVDRGGAIREQLVALESDDAELDLRIDHFPAVAPIGPMLGADAEAVQSLVREALDKAEQRWPGADLIVLLCHWASGRGDPGRPFAGIRLFPWRASGLAFNVVEAPSVFARLGELDWAAAAVPVAAGKREYILEMKDRSRTSRQVLLTAPGWQTRIFLRRRPAPSVTGHKDPCEARDTIDVSIQMGRRGAPCVYCDHYETIEVSRNILAKGRALATPELILSLLHGKFDNPIHGIVGLHLMLGLLEYAKLHPDSDMGADHLRTTTGREPSDYVAMVLRNLSDVLAVRDDEDLPADLVALQARAGFATDRHFRVKAPPMFWASWDALRSNAVENGCVSIGRDLWQSLGDGAPWGPYLAWSPRRDGLERRLDALLQRLAERETPAARSLRKILKPSRDLAAALGIPYSVSHSLRAGGKRRGAKKGGRQRPAGKGAGRV